MSNNIDNSPLNPKRIGVAADHNGSAMKKLLAQKLEDHGFEVIDFGDYQIDPDDDYPDYVVPLAYAVARREVDRGIAVCGSGVGASVIANKIPGVRACLIHESFSAHQGVEDDDLNLMCLGGSVLGTAFAWELVVHFLHARFTGEQRHLRRLSKVAELEIGHIRP